jgi:hypothetical protein
MTNASQGPKAALGWGPSASADSTLEMRLSGVSSGLRIDLPPGASSEI